MKIYFLDFKSVFFNYAKRILQPFFAMALYGLLRAVKADKSFQAFEFPKGNNSFYRKNRMNSKLYNSLKPCYQLLYNTG